MREEPPANAKLMRFLASLLSAVLALSACAETKSPAPPVGLRPASAAASPSSSQADGSFDAAPRIPVTDPIPALPPIPPAAPLPAEGVVAPGTYFQDNPYIGPNAIYGCGPPIGVAYGNDAESLYGKACSNYERIIFTLPAGWATSDGYVYKHFGQPGEVAFRAWTVDQVYADPCHWQGSLLSPLDIHINLLFSDLRSTLPARSEIRGYGGLPNQEGRNASTLTQVTLGNWSALKIELSVPADLDVSTCDKGQFRSWTELNVVDGANSHNAPGQIDDIYMFDIDRRPLVIDASHMPASSAADQAELEAIVASIFIVH
jgi:hypothetical protein